MSPKNGGIVIVYEVVYFTVYTRTMYTLYCVHHVLCTHYTHYTHCMVHTLSTLYALPNGHSVIAANWVPI